MLDDFMVRAVLAATGTAIATGALGCFVVWRRMAYFGDATAHAAILGVALSLVFSVSISLGVLITAFAMALLITDLSKRGIAMDTALGVLAHGALAMGLVAVALIPGARINLEAYLFGDILTVSKASLGVIWGGAALVTGLLVWRWQALLAMTVAPDLAHAAGIDPKREQLILTLVLATVVAVSIKVVGALLITALLIMAVLATGVGLASALLGLLFAHELDITAGPMIICVAIALFALLTLAGRLRPT